MFLGNRLEKSAGFAGRWTIFLPASSERHHCLKSALPKWQPLVDISETDTHLIVKAELPGIDAKDVDVSITGDRLTIKGEKQQEKEEKEENRYRSERYYGAYQRVIDLPASIEEDKTVATFDKGILTITLPKVEKVKKKQIKIKVK